MWTGACVQLVLILFSFLCRRFKDVVVYSSCPPAPALAAGDDG